MALFLFKKKKTTKTVRGVGYCLRILCTTFKAALRGFVKRSAGTPDIANVRL